jgi:hypothetical protein
VIESIEADPHIEIYGLGLMSTSVKHYYKRHVTVDHGGNLEEALLSLIDKAIV